MMQRIRFAPTLQCASLLHMGDDILTMDQLGLADYYHVDIMDLSYVPNLALCFDHIAQLKKFTNTPLDVHLMTVHPLEAIQRSIDAGADRISFHQTEQSVMISGLQGIRSAGLSAGIALSPDDSPETLLPYLHLLDYSIIMGVKPGFAGQSFIEQTFDRVRRLHALCETLEIEVDGGLDGKLCAQCAASGASTLVLGAKAIFMEGQSIREAYHHFNESYRRAMGEERNVRNHA